MTLIRYDQCWYERVTTRGTETHAEGRQVKGRRQEVAVYKPRRESAPGPSFKTLRRNQPCRQLDLGRRPSKLTQETSVVQASVPLRGPFSSEPGKFRQRG